MAIHTRAPASPSPAAGTDATNAARFSAAEVPSITSLRLSPHGAEASLVNISSNGLLAECTVRLKVGSAVTVLFEGGFTPASVPGRVARFEVSAMGRDGVLRYQVGIAFNEPIVVGSAPEAPPPVTELFPESSLTALPPPDAPAPVVAPPVVRNRW